MNTKLILVTCSILVSLTSISCNEKNKNDSKSAILFKQVNLIDGNGGEPVVTNVLIQADTIAEIGTDIKAEGAKIIDLSGKTVMPALISAHVHVGVLKGTTNKPENYTRENVLSQLKKYTDYGISNILAMGTDRPFIFESGLRDSSVNGLIPGARLFSAGYGFGAPAGGMPPAAAGMDHIYRPTDTMMIAAEMDSLALLKPTVVKIWVDNYSSPAQPRLTIPIAKKIIQEAHKHNLRVCAHVFYTADAEQLVNFGVDILGHSIRDTVISDALVQQMKLKNIAYIPTLTLDKFGYIYAEEAPWLNDNFFKNALEPGVLDMINAPGYRDSSKKSPMYAKSLPAFSVALLNLKKLSDAGILIVLGTDSGAQPLRAQGFSEHLELELMVLAGLTPQQALTAATRNAATLLRINDQFGTLEKGKIADLLILDKNPLEDIKNTRTISAVYKAGKEVSKGPIAK